MLIIKMLNQPEAKSTFLLLLIICMFHLSFSQIDNNPFYRYQKLDTSYYGDLRLSVSHLSFNKDNEYFNKIADGYTLFGNQLSSSLVYFPAKNVRLEAGIYLRKDFGNTNYSEIAPILSVKVKQKNMMFIFGNLEGSLNHNLVEPLYDFEKVMLDKQENGIQFLLDNEKFDFDFWLNWEKMLYRGDSIQEKVSGGWSSKIIVLDNEKHKLYIPLQLTAMHKGGQIDASPLPLTSIFNSCVGMKFDIKYNSHFLHGISFEPYYLYYNDFSFEHQDVYDKGNGIYLNFTLKTMLNDIMISYWDGNKYISTHGGLLYNSRSTTYKYPDYTEPHRRLLIVRFLTDIKIFERLHISSRFEPLYDFTRKKIDFSLGLYINYYEDFLIKNIKRNSQRN